MIKPRCKVPKTEAAEPGSVKWRCRISPTVTLSIIALRSAGWGTVRVPNIGHLRAIFGSKEGVLELLTASLALKSVTVDEMRRPTPYAVPCEVCKWLRAL